MSTSKLDRSLSLLLLEPLEACHVPREGCVIKWINLIKVGRRRERERSLELELNYKLLHIGEKIRVASLRHDRSSKTSQEWFLKGING